MTTTCLLIHAEANNREGSTDAGAPIIFLSEHWNREQGTEHTSHILHRLPGLPSWVSVPGMPLTDASGPLR